MISSHDKNEEVIILNSIQEPPRYTSQSEAVVPVSEAPAEAPQKLRFIL